MKHNRKLLGVLSILVVAGLLGFAVNGGAGDPVPAEADAPFNSYTPEQPIPYSHKLHAGELEIDCQFCHTYARRSRAAGIPATEQCMACHSLIAADKDPIKAMTKAYERKDAINWVKVHDLPDFVFFSHKRHVQHFECQDCHGQVQTMEVVHREASLTMGWCLNCHQDNLDKGASVDCMVCHK